MLGPYDFNTPCRRDLTPREREVLDYVLAGKPNKLTAYSLGISQRTVEVHRSRIFQKLGVRNAIELVTAIYTHGSPAARLLAEPRPGPPADDHLPRKPASADNGAAAL
jgi:DNA-binding CsgD family transcriptional regulator